MELVSHVALFYLLGRRAGIRKLWAGMIASALPDASLALFVWLGPPIGIQVPLETAWTLSLFLHSVFALALLLPVAALSMRYLAAMLSGYGLHLLVDYLTHTVVRMPFFPLSAWKAPTFLVSYLDPAFLIATAGAILAGIVILEGRWLAGLPRNLSNRYRGRRVWTALTLYAAATCALAIWYTVSVVGVGPPFLFACFPLVGANLAAIGILFAREVYGDENIPDRLRRMARRLLGEPKSLG